MQILGWGKCFFFISDSSVNFQEIDIYGATTKDLEFTSPFHLTAKEMCRLTALIGFFDTSFNKLASKVRIVTLGSEGLFS